MDVATMDVATLQQELKRLQAEADLLGTSQHAKKVLLSSLYGALANGYFRHHRTKDAEAITIQGQQAVRYLAKRISHFISALVDETVSPDEIYVYGDTDSVTGDSLININGNLVRIDDVFEQTDGEIHCSSNGTEVKMTSGMSTETIDDFGEIVQRPVRYVMKHKVKKRMFRIRVGKSEVTVTEDHSLIIRRNGKIMDATVAQIQSGDELIEVLRPKN